ncbi:solute carrier family 22 member 18 isoform X2 [Piliocolobus tephrosceles]|uniref:Solute carrier family 22 member 18 n=1 Tax=Piliocolobus tephrosceles TaxID=591936 RepID=A0A8C9GQA3_9PRIM|nr:solute carrier family 22 member 18 isoform X2 [Piliocolobus tephrosceles]
MTKKKKKVYPISSAQPVPRLPETLLHLEEDSARPGGCCLGPSDSAPPPRSTGLLPPAPPASCLDLSWVSLLCPSRMQGAWSPRDQVQSPGRMSALGRSSVILLTYVLAAIELTCLFMQFSVLPYLSRKLGLDSIAFGYLQTTFGVLQLLGGPVFGRFADQRGARAALTLSFLAALALYLLLAAASSPALPGVYLLFASRLPGALMHTLPAAQMVITDLSAPEERPAALGRLGLCFGVGVILGSLLGGTLVSAYGIQCPAILAALATLLGAVLSFTCIPASTKGTKTNTETPPPGLFMVMFSIISMEFFQLEAAQAGYLMSFFGLLQMVTQGLVIGQLSSRFSEEALLRASVLGFIAVGLAMAWMSSVFHFCLLVPGLVFSFCTLNVVTDSMLTKAVSTSDTGAMLGLCASVQPLLRTLGPTVGGFLYRSFGVPIFGHVQVAINVLVLLVLWRKPMPQKKDKVW